jgi:hypothetical protein
MNADKTAEEDGSCVYFKFFALVLSALISADQRPIFFLLFFFLPPW